MVMNYVLSFCKITAASRIFSRNFYLPLLKPLTPKDAKRTLKITGKWLLGSKIHHYIPVMLNHRKKRAKRLKNYGKKTHHVDPDYTYVTPIIDENNESHQRLLKILEDLPGFKKNDKHFVYCVNDKMQQVVITEAFESAIRNGDIIDVMISSSSNRIMFKMKDFKKVRFELELFEVENAGKLYAGEGATTKEEESFHHHGKATMRLAKIFEAKEIAEELELEMMKVIAKRRKQKFEGTEEWNKMVSESLKNMNWDMFEENAKKVVDHINEPVKEEKIEMKVQDLVLYNNALIKELCLPSITDIPDVINCLANGTYKTLANGISGVEVELSDSRVVFIIGKMIESADGEIFIPGQAVENDFGLSYAPGITVMGTDGEPSLIKGLIMGDEDDKAEKDVNRKAVFVPTESSITVDGELTFCQTPEERVKFKAKPKKIFVKKGKNKSKEKKEKQLQRQQSVTEDKSVNTLITYAGCDIEVEFTEPEAENVSNVINNVPEILMDGIVVDEEIDGAGLDSETEILVQIQAADISEETDNEISSLSKELEEDEAYNSDVTTYDVDKMPDDGMNKLIHNLEDKKSELEAKLEALRKLKNKVQNEITYVTYENAFELAGTITDNADEAHKISEILLTLTTRMMNFHERKSIKMQNLKKTDVLENSVYLLNEIFKKHPKNQMLAMQSAFDMLKGTWTDPKSLREMILSMNTQMERDNVITNILNELTRPVQVDKNILLQQAINNEDFDELLDVYSESFAKSLKRIKNSSLKAVIFVELESLNNVEDIEEATRKAIKKYLSAQKISHLKDEAENLANLINATPNEDFLRRFLLIKILCEKDFSALRALEKLEKYPSAAMKDPRLKQLLVDTANLLCMNRPVKNSLLFPKYLLQEQNHLAIEDRIRLLGPITHPILVSRGGCQIVIPADATKDVNSGKVAYILMDECGSSLFKPVSAYRNEPSFRRKSSISMQRLTPDSDASSISEVSRNRMAA